MQAKSSSRQMHDRNKHLTYGNRLAHEKTLKHINVINQKLVDERRFIYIYIYDIINELVDNTFNVINKKLADKRQLQRIDKKQQSSKKQKREESIQLIKICE